MELQEEQEQEEEEDQEQEQEQVAVELMVLCPRGRYREWQPGRGDCRWRKASKLEEEAEEEWVER